MPARESPAPKASRPHMPGYGVPSSCKGMLPWKWAERRLARSHNYWVVTTRPDGAPHAMPVWGIWTDSAFYFSTGRQTRKARNLAANPHCVVLNERPEEAVILEGAAEEITDVSRLKALGKPYYRKYKPWQLDPAMGAIYVVRPRVVFAQYEKKFAPTATRWKF
jgi:general stress protein 26